MFKNTCCERHFNFKYFAVSHSIIFFVYWVLLLILVFEVFLLCYGYLSHVWVLVLLLFYITRAYQRLIYYLSFQGNPHIFGGLQLQLSQVFWLLLLFWVFYDCIAHSVSVAHLVKHDSRCLVRSPRSKNVCALTFLYKSMCWMPKCVFKRTSFGVSNR